MQSFYSENMIRDQLYLDDFLRVIPINEDNKIASYYSNLNELINNNSAAYEMIHHHLHFLDFFAACTKDELCQMRGKSNMHKLFSEQARRIYIGFHPFVCEQRKNRNIPWLWQDLEEYVFPFQNENDNAKKRCDAYFGV